MMLGEMIRQQSQRHRRPHQLNRQRRRSRNRSKNTTSSLQTSRTGGGKFSITDFRPWSLDANHLTVDAERVWVFNRAKSLDRGNSGSVVVRPESFRWIASGDRRADVGRASMWGLQAHQVG